MDDAPQDIYAKYLPKHRGYPLWVPRLSNAHDLPREYQEDGIQIGDLGVVDADTGFNVILNVRKAADHPLHARWRNKGLPTFVPICLDRQDIIVKSDAVRINTVVSSGVTRIDPPSRPNTEYEFVPSSAEGAILILPEGAMLHDLRPKNQFRDLAIQHASDWYRFAVRCLQQPISNHSLYLVTGFFKTRSWSLASFKNAKPGDGDSHRIWVTKTGEGDDSGNYNWGHAFHIEWNDGPRRGPNQNLDQCIFVRGFKIALRDEIFGLVTQRVTDLVSNKELHVVIKWWRFSFLRWIFRWKKKSGMVSGQNSSIDPTHEPMLSQPFHPSDTVNRFLLGKDTTMTVSVTHDTEWIELLEKGRLSSNQLMQEGYFVRYLSEKCSFDPQNGVVYVEVECDEASRYASSGCSTSGGGEHEPPRGPAVVADISEPCADIAWIVNVITSFRGDQLTCPGCVPIECHVSVQSVDRKQRTKDRPVRAGEVTVWDDLILLPSDLSTPLRISICAFSESTYEVEELHIGEVTVKELLRDEFIWFDQNGEDSDESSHPSLLVNTGQKNLDDLDDSLLKDAPTSFRPREQSLHLAKVAEQDKCWEDVVHNMKNIALLDRELTQEERDLLFAGYEGLIAVSRILCDGQKLEEEIIRICEEILDILERHLMPSATSTESVVFYGRMIGDYHRCLSEFYVESRRKECMIKSLAAYEGTWSIAKSGLSATHPIRLRLALNFSLLYYEVLHGVDQAIRVAEETLEDARAGLEGSEECSASAPILRLLCDNVARWKLEDNTSAPYLLDECMMEREGGQGGGEDADGLRYITKKTDGLANVEHDRDPVSRQPPDKPVQDVTALDVDHFAPEGNPSKHATALDTQTKPGSDDDPSLVGLGDTHTVSKGFPICWAKALYAYNNAFPDDSDEISFAKGEILEIIDKGSNWWKARQASRTETGTTGVAPASPDEQDAARSFPGSNAIDPVKASVSAIPSPSLVRPRDVLKAKALYGYTPRLRNHNEISFTRGEVLQILDKQGKWWQVKKADGTIGIALSANLRIIASPGVKDAARSFSDPDVELTPIHSEREVGRVEKALYRYLLDPIANILRPATTRRPERRFVSSHIADEFRHYILNHIPARFIETSKLTFVERHDVFNVFSAEIAQITEMDVQQRIEMDHSEPEAGTYVNVRKRALWEIIRDVVRYAIFSHRWTDSEPSYQDIAAAGSLRKKRKPRATGSAKLVRLCETARTLGYKFVWSDTCCIDKSNANELSEAIPAMFKWYANSHLCIVHLAGSLSLAEFQREPWFTRGWTLQELLAPRRIKFYDRAWRPFTNLHNDKEDLALMSAMSTATGIPRHVIAAGNSRGIQGRGVWEIMSWAAPRKTARIEDLAYCLMGLFGVQLPIAYGEGERAFPRLVLEILSRYDHWDAFAWSGEAWEAHPALPSSPACYPKWDEAMVGEVVGMTEFTLMSRGLRLTSVPPIPLAFASEAVDGPGSYMVTLRSRSDKFGVYGDVSVVCGSRRLRRIRDATDLHACILNYKPVPEDRQGELQVGRTYVCLLLYMMEGRSAERRAWLKVRTDNVLRVTCHGGVDSKGGGKFGLPLETVFIRAPRARL